MTLRSEVVRVGGEAREQSTAQFATDVQYYLTLSPRQLPSHYLYDALGSALFDAICELPWYGITRAEGRLVSGHRNEVFARLGRVSTVIELGSGNGEKLRSLVLAQSRPAGKLTIRLIDVSESALRTSERTLAELDDVVIVSHRATYEEGLDRAAREPRGAGRTLALFLGSNIGNFDRPASNAFLRAVRAGLRAGDALLIGADLVKPESDLLLAYDDPLGVTGAFNRNLLVRINRELGGDFDVNGFEHRAVWNRAASRMEMHLVARRSQRVRIEAAQVDLEIGAGEAIWTESSYKYEADEIADLVERAGFRRAAQWIDTPDRFAWTLFEAV